MRITVADLPMEQSKYDPDYLLGRAIIGTAPFHVEAVRVVETDGVQVATTPLNARRLDDLNYAHGDGAFCTVEIPGHEGYWVLWITPYLT